MPPVLEQFGSMVYGLGAVVDGEGGIRTLERSQPPLRDFQSRPFNRSGTSPLACDAQAVPEGYDTMAFAVGRLAV
jgi:hypothetical protein